MTRARGHFNAPVKRPGVYRRQRRRSELWAKYRFRVRRLAAGESIREAFVSEMLSPRGEEGPLRDTVEFFERLEREYADEGGQGNYYLGEFSDWYQEMLDEYPDEFRYPQLDLYYHGKEKG